MYFDPVSPTADQNRLVLFLQSAAEKLNQLFSTFQIEPDDSKPSVSIGVGVEMPNTHLPTCCNRINNSEPWWVTMSEQLEESRGARRRRFISCRNSHTQVLQLRLFDSCCCWSPPQSLSRYDRLNLSNQSMAYGPRLLQSTSEWPPRGAQQLLVKLPAAAVPLTDPADIPRLRFAVKTLGAIMESPGELQLAICSAALDETSYPKCTEHQ